MSFVIKTIRCANGERLPSLINSESGLPDFEATLWILTNKRPTGLASATIEQALRSVGVLYKILHLLQIDLTSRFQKSEYLELSECTLIVNALKLKSREIKPIVFGLQNVTAVSNVRSISKFEGLRQLQGIKNTDIYVEASTSAIRLGYVREFLSFLINRFIAKNPKVLTSKLKELRDQVDTILRINTPNEGSRSVVGNRHGLHFEDQAELLVWIHRDHPTNPWKNELTRIRNQIIISAFLLLGIRRGELLGLQLEDLKPQQKEILILRRPDNNSDPRLNEPNTKTRDRVLTLPEPLYRLIKVYLILRHNIVKGHHSFVFVANNGNPLSKSGLQRVFNEIKFIPNFPHISPHILRHSYFENLASELHQKGVEQEQVLSFLRQQGGWSDTSNSPRIYTKRFTQEKAFEASISMQSKLSLNLS